MTARSDLESRRCKPCEGGQPLPPGEIRDLLGQLDGWKLDPGGKEIQTMAFVNALAWVAHREDHHPDLAVGYKKCVVRYSTHAVGGLSENDFICAAKVDALVRA